MKKLFCVAICVVVHLFEVTTQDVTTISLVHSTRRLNPVASLIKRMPPKTFKRSPISSPHFVSPSARIINMKTPFNVLQNGPYFINHYIYCENLDQHTLEQIKAGALTGDKLMDLLNLHGVKFHSLNGVNTLGSSELDGLKLPIYKGDKEVHILQLPKDKHHDFNGIKSHLSLPNVHATHEESHVDLELNKNFGSFEVNLGSIKPLDLDSSLLPTPTTSAQGNIVKPLFQGQLPRETPSKFIDKNPNQFTQFLNKYTHVESIDQSDVKEGSIDVPHFEQHPLEHDPSKSSYDTPGAVDSYGHPVTETQNTYNSNFHNQQYGHQPDLSHLIPNENQGGLSSSFQNVLNSEDFYKNEDLFNQVNELPEASRKRRQGNKSQGNEEKSASKSSSSSEAVEEVRHPNHRYD